MRSSSRRLKVTSACGGGRGYPRPRATRLVQFRRIPCGASGSSKFRHRVMIAPDGRGGKSLARPRIDRPNLNEISRLNRLSAAFSTGRNHGFVKNHNAAPFQPSTRQAGLRNNGSLPQGPIRIALRIPQPPSPPGCGRIGPEFRVRFNPPILRPAIVPAFFVGRACVRSGCRIARSDRKRGYRGQRSSPPLIPVICRPSPVVRSERTRCRGRCPVFRAFLPARSARRHRCRRFRSRRSECSSLRPCR